MEANTHTHTHAHTCMHAQPPPTHTRVHTHTHTRTCTHTHIRTHHIHREREIHSEPVPTILITGRIAQANRTKADLKSGRNRIVFDCLPPAQSGSGLVTIRCTDQTGGQLYSAILKLLTSPAGFSVVSEDHF